MIYLAAIYLKFYRIKYQQYHKSAYYRIVIFDNNNYYCDIHYTNVFECNNLNIDTIVITGILGFR